MKKPFSNKTILNELNHKFSSLEFTLSSDGESLIVWTSDGFSDVPWFEFDSKLERVTYLCKHDDYEDIKFMYETCESIINLVNKYDN